MTGLIIALPSSLLSPLSPARLNPLLLQHFSPTPGLISPPLLARLIHLASNPLPPLFTPSLAPLLSFPSTPLLPVQQDCRPVGACPPPCSLFQLKKKKRKRGEGGGHLRLNFCKKRIKHQLGGGIYLDSTCVVDLFFFSCTQVKTGAHACFSFLSSPR